MVAMMMTVFRRGWGGKDRKEHKKEEKKKKANEFISLVQRE